MKKYINTYIHTYIYIYIYIYMHIFELAEALILDCRTKDWTKSFYLKLDSLNYNTLQALILWLTNTSALQTRHLLTKYTCTHLTSRHLHTLALDSISLNTLATYGTYFTTSYNFTHLSLDALWHSSLHKSLTSLTHTLLISLISHTSLTHFFTYYHIYLY